MDDISEIIVGEIDRQFGQAKQSEDQRATLSNFIIVLCLAAQGFIVDKDFPRRALILAIVLIVLGIFGVIATGKYYERFRMSMSRVGRLREQLDSIHPELQLDETETRADRRHAERHSFFHGVRLHYLWELLMYAILLLGSVDAFMILKYGH